MIADDNRVKAPAYKLNLSLLVVISNIVSIANNLIFKGMWSFFLY